MKALLEQAKSRPFDDEIECKKAILDVMLKHLDAYHPRRARASIEDTGTTQPVPVGYVLDMFCRS